MAYRRAAGRRRIGRKAAIVLVLSGFLAAMSGGEGRAGAWTLPEGAGQVLLSGSYMASSRAFGASGNPMAAPRFSKADLGAYFEYGLTGSVTAVFQPRLRRTSIGAPVNATRTGLGYTDVGLRTRLWSGTRSVLSAQTVARIPGGGEASNPAAVGSTDPEFDIRLQAGRSGTIGAWPFFTEVQIGYRIRFGDPPNEFRADLAFGARPRGDVLILAQSFNTIADGSARGVFLNTREHKLQLSVVWDFAKAWSLQIGGIATVAGRNTPRERGLVVALWHRF